MSGASKVRRGSTFTSKSFQITNIKSKRLEDRKSGLIRYAIQVKVRNRINHPLTFTLGLQAIDRSGYEVEDVLFYREYVKPRGTAYLTDRNLLDIDLYNDIWEWKVQTLKVF